MVRQLSILKWKPSRACVRRILRVLRRRRVCIPERRPCEGGKLERAPWLRRRRNPDDASRSFRSQLASFPKAGRLSLARAKPKALMRISIRI